jgi:hypothetical protein
VFIHQLATQTEASGATLAKLHSDQSALAREHLADSSRLYSPAIARFMLLIMVALRLPSFSNCSAQ